ncbi:glutathione S-transferase family protein [Roseomonas sp. NAR14]|uniref:glutathione transferase n=1 Tax=Roseomonas acroporae TaxID=2937791 RepID=A0A9X1YBU9_9PROT|nr:glutathione S-transferase family protein [Roseomonas acroporae]MCK8787584.1 glutathione S-transferase family protein [Roseomonas acroporae]
MLRVHHLNNSRSQRILWLLEELGLDYEVVRYERDPQTMLAPPSLRAVHPLGKSPVLQDGDAVLAESGAIIEYLVGRHGDGRLVPPPGGEAHRRYLHWLHFAEGSMMTPRLVRFWLRRLGEAGKPGIEAANAQMAGLLAFVESSLGDDPWLTGADFTAADIQMSFPLEAEAGNGVLDDGYPRLRGLLARLHARPAYQRALQRGGPYAYA